MTKRVQTTTAVGVQIPQGNTQVLLLSTLSFAICFAVWCVYSPLGPHLRDELHLSESQLALLVSIPALLGSAARLPMGILTDMYGSRRVATVLMVACFFSTMLGMYANSYLTFVFCGLLIGMAGSIFAVGVPHVSRWYPPERQGLAVGIFGLGNMGAAISTMFGERIIHYYLNDQWRNIFPVYAVPLLLIAVLYWKFAPDSPVTAKPNGTNELLYLVKKTPLVWVFCLFYWVTFGGFVAFALYLPTYFVMAYNVPHVTAGDLATTFVFTASLIRPLGGDVADRLPGRKILQALFAVAALCLITEGLAPSLTVATCAFILLGACFGMGNGVIFKLVPTYFARETGAVGGLVGAAGGLGGFFTPVILGISKDFTGSYAGGFAVAASFCLICLYFTRKEFQRVES